ncbi:MAG TPA: efflux RND transporter permease subunit, partial [Tepidisphaeraceae bacterium]|nr:efflux RND transporter permease subunit [Tepidisphaeraceae bacterium]
ASAFTGKEPTEAITLVFVGNALDQDRESRDRAIAAVRKALEGVNGATVTGLSVVAHDAEQTVRTELPRLIWIAALIVVLYLAVQFRNLADVSLALLPTVFGLLVGAAFLRLIGERLNMVNLVAVPLLIGIDVDYGIFLVTLSRWKRMREETAEELRTSIDPPVHAVIICATATILGYVSLIWTSVPAERSLGIAASAGIGACLVGVLFLLVPLFFSLARRR